MKMLLLLAMLVSTQVFAHGDHAKPIAKCAAKCTKEEIEKAAPTAVGTLILGGAIDKGWASLKPEKVYTKNFAKGPEWVAEYFDKSQNPKKQRLFIFITMDGYLNGSNYSGN